MTNSVISSVKKWSYIHVEAKSVVFNRQQKEQKSMKWAILDETYRFSTHSIIRLVGDFLRKLVGLEFTKLFFLPNFASD